MDIASILSNINRIAKKVFIFTIVNILIVCFFVLFVNIYINIVADGHVKTDYNVIEKIEDKPIALVLGAAVGSDILKDRLDTAKNFYDKGIIAKIIVSGDNSRKEYNEPISMQQYLISQGVEESDIYVDYAGFDTYDSIYRANYIFGAEKILIFSQEFHLNRAVYIGQKLGLDVNGIISDRHEYRHIKYNYFREYFSRVKAFLDADILHSKPKFLGEKIEIEY